jgi:hypothetical protein
MTITNLSQEINRRVSASLKKFEGTSLPSSCLIIGVHKGGSTLLHNFIRIYINQLPPALRPSSINIPTILFRKMGLNDLLFDLLEVLPNILLKNRGYCYYGWRQIPASFLQFKPRLSHLPAIVLIRDPRDCAVSAYYSFLNTHKLPEDHESPASREILEERRKSANVGIDEWVLENIGRFTGELSRVASFLHINLRLYKYEDIWNDKAPFFHEIIEYIGLPFSEDAFSVAYEETDIIPGQDSSGHVRKATPGDHLEKLKETTIAEVNDKYYDLFRLFGYL